MAVSDSSQYIHERYALWLDLEAKLARVNSGDDAPPTLEGLLAAQQRTADELLVAMRSLAFKCLANIKPAVRATIEAELFDEDEAQTTPSGRSGHWALALCEQLVPLHKPKHSIRSVIQDEIKAIRQAIAEDVDRDPGDAQESALLELWQRYEAARQAYGHETEALRDQLLIALHPLVERAAAWCCRNDEELAGRVISTVMVHWLSQTQGLLHPFDPHRSRIVAWVWIRVRLTHRHLTTDDRRKLVKSVPLASDSGGDADLMDAYAGSRLGSQLRKRQLSQRMSAVLADLRQSISAQQRMPLTLTDGQVLSAWQPLPVHWDILAASLAEQIELARNIKDRQALKALTGFERTKNDRLMNEAFAYVLQHPLAADLRELIAPSTVPHGINALHARGGGGGAIAIIAPRGQTEAL